MLAGNRRVVRKSEARMACSPDGRLHMLVREPEFCHYVFVIYSPALCQVGGSGVWSRAGGGDLFFGGGLSGSALSVCFGWGRARGAGGWRFGVRGRRFCNLADASVASPSVIYPNLGGGAALLLLQPGWRITRCLLSNHLLFRSSATPLYLLSGGEVQAGRPSGGGQEGLPGGG